MSKEDRSRFPFPAPAVLGMCDSVLCCGAIWMVSSCKPSPPPPAGPATAVTAKGCAYEVKSPDGRFNKGQANSFSLNEGGPNSTSYQKGRLTVNGKDYGEMADGSALVVEADGRVLVDGVERKEAASGR